MLSLLPSRQKLSLLLAVALAATLLTGVNAAGAHPTPPAPSAPAPTASPPTPKQATGCPEVVDTAAAGTEAVPPALVDSLTTALGDRRLTGNHVGVSIWVEGFGEVFANRPDEPLRPASNEKILTAMGALEILGPDATFTTQLVATGPVEGSVLNGDLVLVGGGDPWLALKGADSIETLVTALKAAGVTRVAGALVYDDFRYDDVFTLPGWPSGAVPGDIGPVSAITVERNRYRGDPTFTTRPGWSNAALLRVLLNHHGVAIDGETKRLDLAPDTGTVLASTTSPPVSKLVQHMLMYSDNAIAEALVKEVAYRAQGKGTTASGAATMVLALAASCLPAAAPGAVAFDGSGLSRNNQRSARQWRELLLLARQEPWFATFAAGLPVAGQSGTLQRRFVGTVGAGVVSAKTGTILNTRTLSGYATTVGGRDVVFSVILNGRNTGQANAAIENLVNQVVAFSG